MCIVKGLMTEPIATEMDDRDFQRQKIAALLTARSPADVEPDELRLITPHYQQRISELRVKHQMHIENRPRFLALANGTKKKRDGAYRLLPYAPLGRDSGTIIAQGWNHDGPFTEEFRLK